MTYERLYRADDFRLANEAWIANRTFGAARASGHYESMRLCSRAWRQSDRLHGVCSTQLSSDDPIHDAIAPFLAPLDPWLLSLVNADDGRPPATALDLELFDAVSRADIERALRLIDQGSNVNALDKYGETPLTKLATASKFDHYPSAEAQEAGKTQADLSQEERIEMMWRLLERGADINLFGFEGVNSLTEAVLNAEDEVVRFLLNEGADPNHNQFPDDDLDDVSTPLFYAANDFSLAQRGSPEEAKLERIYESLKKAGAIHSRGDERSPGRE